jgi:Flp pilus assembly protein CpaB
MLHWHAAPTLAGPSETPERQPRTISTREIVVAAERIELGSSIGLDMLTPITVPAGATNAMTFTDTAALAGEVAAIDILENQPITPNMLVDE